MTAFPGAGLIIRLIFGLFVGATVAGALLAALSTRVIRSVAGLAMCCVGMAGLYYFLRSPFLALMEILIYVGAVCVTIIFAIMLAEPDEAPHPKRGATSALWGAGALLLSGLIFWSLARLGLHASWNAPASRVTDGSLPAVGRALLTTYSLAFELISLVLLVAILGALLIARYGRSRP
jgi:NADH-quinone oxidoreductase subunit J